jgi:NAD(P)-dependent dehydrogenase (short-subunit alcohol dehydrogenase family)
VTQTDSQRPRHDSATLQPWCANALDAGAISRVADTTGPVDTVVVCVGGGRGLGPFRDLDLEEVKAAFEEKTVAQLRGTHIAARHMRPNASITLVIAGSARPAIAGALPVVVEHPTRTISSAGQ